MDLFNILYHEYHSKKTQTSKWIRFISSSEGWSFCWIGIGDPKTVVICVFCGRIDCKGGRQIPKNYK